MSSLSVIGRPFGKTAGITQLFDVRLILPHSSLMGLLDCLLAARLNVFIDEILPRKPNHHSFVGARPHTQVLDIAHICQTAVEKGIDSKSNCAIAQGDVEKYFDSLQLFKILRWLHRFSFPGHVLCGVFRLQVFTTLYVMLADSCTKKQVRCRHIGGLTGSRTAVALARIPIEQMLVTLDEALKTNAFLGRVSIGCYVDNLFAIGNSITGAVNMLQDCEAYLQEHWNLRLKPSSLEVMPVAGYGDVEEFSERWTLVSGFKVLGHRIQSSGAIDVCWDYTLKAAWRQFWGNIGRPAFRKFDVSLKRKRLESLVLSVIRFRLSRWPFCASKAKALDVVQRKMVGHILNFKFSPALSVEANLRRKQRLVSETIQVRWSRIWASSVVKWSEHVSRNTLGCCWSAQIADICTPEQLALRRAQNHARPDTRSIAGFVALRWYESINCARTFD